MKIASPKLHTAHLTANEEALVKCQAAIEQKDKGDYEGAQKLMSGLWRGVGERPETKGLHASVSAEVMLCVGILTGWIGSKFQIKDAQATARDLITESISYFESVGDRKKVAASQVELAYCYRHDGELDEARTLLREALQKLTTEGETRARALLKLAKVEWAAELYSEALTILTDNVSLFQKVPNHTTRGAYHNQLAAIYRNLATPESCDEYFRLAIKEYKQADYYFSLGGNPVFQSDAKCNAGFLLSKVSRFKEALEYLNAARRLTVNLRDKARKGIVDEARAQVLLAQGKLKEAEVVARKAVSALEKTGHRRFVTSALTTHATALARLRRTEHAQFVFQRAIKLACQHEDYNLAGLATLTLIEELDHLLPATLHAAYQQAREWLKGSRRHEVLIRLTEAAEKVTSAREELSSEEATGILLTRPCSLQDTILKYEKTLIKQALAQANGRVTRAASLLSVSYQALTYIIEARHKDLLKERTPVYRRRHRTSRGIRSSP